MIRVIVESPFAAATPEGIEANKAYARECMRDSLLRGESPLLSHLLYTQVIDDSVLSERELGIEAGFTWIKHAQKMALYIDKGISKGMLAAREVAKRAGIKVVERSIKSWG
jgi:hypothetical protein